MGKLSSSFMKAGMLYTACQFLTKGFSFFITPFISRIMSVSDYGIVSNFMVCQAVIMPIVTLYLESAVGKSKYKYYEDNDSFVVSIVLMSGLTTFISFLVCSIGKGYFSTLFGIRRDMVGLLFLYAFMFSVFETIQSQCVLFYKHKKYVIITLAYSLANLLLSLLFVICFTDKAMGRVLGMTLTMTVISVVLVAGMMVKGVRPRWECVRFALPISVPEIFSALAYTLLGSSDRTMITNLRGEEETALYSMAYTVGTVAMMFRMGLNEAKGPWLMDRLNKEAYGEIKEPAKRSFFYYSAMVVLLMLVAPELLYVMGGERYMDAVRVIPPVIISMALMFAYTFYQSVAYYYQKNIHTSIATIISACVNIGLNYLLIPRFGYMAAAYTTLVGYALLMFLNYLIVKYAARHAFVYDNWYFVKAILTLAIIQYGLYLIYDFCIIRYIITAIYAVIAIRYVWKNGLLDRVVSIERNREK